jgi:hypothetical protein
MRLKMKVTGVTKITGHQLLVQLQGEYGNAQLSLPTDRQMSFRVGDEYTLEHGMSGIRSIGEPDKVEETRKKELVFGDVIRRPHDVL